MLSSGTWTLAWREASEGPQPCASLQLVKRRPSAREGGARGGCRGEPAAGREGLRTARVASVITLALGDSGEHSRWVCGFVQLRLYQGTRL